MYLVAGQDRHTWVMAVEACPADEAEYTAVSCRHGTLCLNDPMLQAAVACGCIAAAHAASVVAVAPDGVRGTGPRASHGGGLGEAGMEVP